MSFSFVSQIVEKAVNEVLYSGQSASTDLTVDGQEPQSIEEFKLILAEKLSTGGGGLTLYSGDGTLAGNRTVDLGGHTFDISTGSTNSLHIDPTVDAEELSLQAFNSTDGGNAGSVGMQSSPSLGAAAISATFDGSTKTASVAMVANASTSLIAYTADKHVFVGVSEFADNAAAITGGLAVGTIYRTGDFQKIVH